MSNDGQNATLYAGDNAVLNVSIIDENNKPLPLAGASFSWILAASAGSAAVVTKTTGSAGVVVTHAPSGILSVYIGSADTTGLSGAMWHQLVMTDASSNVTTVMTGTISFKVRT